VKEAELQAHIPEESKPGVSPQLTKKMIVDFQPKVERRIRITGCDILPDGKFVFAEQEGKRLLIFSNNGNYEKDIVRFSGTPYEVSYTGENIVAVTIWDKREVVFVNVITNTITFGQDLFAVFTIRWKNYNVACSLTSHINVSIFI
jgi:hypothetical protein